MVKKVNGKRGRGSRKTGRRADTVFELSSRTGEVVFRTPSTSLIRRPTPPTVLAKGVADSGFGVAFEAFQMINWTELSNLYDQYCIDKVQYIIELATPFIANGVYPFAVVAPDYTDVTAPASANAVMELAQSKIYQFSPERTRFVVTIKPKPAMAAFQSAVTSGYAIPSGDTWFASENSSVDHYGLKIWLADYNTTINATTALRAFAVFHVKVRSSR